MSKWETLDSLPTEDCNIHVWIEEAHLKSRVHTASVVNGKIMVVGGVLYFDAPKVLYWQPLLAPPDNE